MTENYSIRAEFYLDFLDFLQHYIDVYYKDKKLSKKNFKPVS